MIVTLLHIFIGLWYVLNRIWTPTIFRKKRSLHACRCPRNHDSTPFTGLTPDVLSGVSLSHLDLLMVAILQAHGLVA